MTALRTALARVRGMFTARRDRDRLDAEIQSHLDLLIDEHLDAGLSPADARAAAARAFGGAAQIREAYLDARRVPLVDHVVRDLRHGLRALRRNPGFTLVGVVTLALGIGANATIFTLVNALLFRPLPIRDADRLTTFARQRSTGDIDTTFSFAEFDALRTEAPLWSSVVAARPRTFGLTIDGRTDRVPLSFVSENYFQAFGLQPSAGSLFRATDPAVQSAAPVIVLSDDFWQRRFRADPAVIGRSLSVGSTPVTIVGVGPRGFAGDSVFQRVSGFLPLHAAGFPMMIHDPLRVLGLLTAPSTLDEANASLGALSNSFADARHETPGRTRLTAYWERDTRPNPRTLRGEVAMTMFFSVMAALVLVLASVNVANLILARTIARKPELALRSALGATRRRLAAHLFVETLLVVLVASAAGVLAGEWAAQGMGAWMPSQLAPFASQLRVSFDWRIAAFALGSVGLTALIVGTLPALGATRTLTNVLHGTNASGTARRRTLGRALMVWQIAGALVLLVIAGLLGRSLSLARGRSFGFDDRGVFDFNLNPEESGYASPRAEELTTAILARAQSLPVVTAAALAASVPMTGYYSEGDVFPDLAVPSDTNTTDIGYSAVSPTYFDTLRIPLHAGRAFSSTDTATSVPVAIINAAMAGTYWPTGSPIGRTFRIGSRAATEVQVVGVVANINNYGAMQDHASPFFYLPLAQHRTPSMTLQVRSTAPPSAVFQQVSAEIHDVAPDVIPYNVQTMADTIDDAPDGLFLFRLGAGLATGLGLLGLTLAVVGVFGVVSYSASQRTREMAVRMALGATARDVGREVLRSGLVVVGTGLAIGAVAAAAVAVLTQNLYVGVSPVDPLTFAGAIALVGTTALVACYVPARRVMRVDPMVTLRAE